MEGVIKPPLSGVKVIVMATTGKMEPVILETKEAGTFR